MANEPTRTRPSEESSPNVVDLGAARAARRLRELEGRCRVADELNRKSLARLFGSGLLYTRQGARLGRELLLAHQLTFRVWEIVGTLSGERPAAPAAALEDAAGAERLAREAGQLLDRVSELTARTEIVLARRR